MRDVLMAARKFRLAIEQSPPKLVSFAFFPAGSCGDASELLGEYFVDSVLGQWVYRTGFGPSASTHGWIEQEGVIADITADQFVKWDAPKPVIVTRDRAWHDRYFPTQAGSRPAGLDFWDGPTHDQVALAYAQLRVLADESDADRLGE